MVRLYIDLLKQALSNIESDYFSIRTASAQPEIVRERVFCYELYHQVRLLMTENNRLMLTVYGEIDKSGNSDYEQEDQKNPDFVFHRPGTHEQDTLVVEVKARIDNTDGIEKDFRTLSKFIENYGYQAGAFVLFGRSFEDLMRARGQEVKDASQKASANRIYLLTIESARAGCEEHVLFSLRAVSSSGVAGDKPNLAAGI